MLLASIFKLFPKAKKKKAPDNKFASHQKCAKNKKINFYYNIHFIVQPTQIIYIIYIYTLFFIRTKFYKNVPRLQMV